MWAFFIFLNLLHMKISLPPNFVLCPCLLFFSKTLATDDGDILLDYSKNIINEDIMAILFAMVTVHSCYSLLHCLWF